MIIDLEENEIRRLIGALFTQSGFDRDGLGAKLKSYLPPDPPREPDTTPVHLVPPYEKGRKQMNWNCGACGRHMLDAATEDGVALIIEYDKSNWEKLGDRRCTKNRR